MGVTFTELPVRDTGDQEYVTAPDAVSVTGVPVQTRDLDAEAVMTGDGFTVIFAVFEFTVPGQEPFMITLYCSLFCGVEILFKEIVDDLAEEIFVNEAPLLVLICH